MLETPESLRILADVLLAGHTLMMKHDGGWITQEFASTGGSGVRRPRAEDPDRYGWNGGLGR